MTLQTREEEGKRDLGMDCMGWMGCVGLRVLHHSCILSLSLFWGGREGGEGRKGREKNAAGKQHLLHSMQQKGKGKVNEPPICMLFFSTRALKGEGRK